MFIRKRFKRKRKTTMMMRGRASVERYDRETGRYLGTMGPWRNTLTAEAFDEFLRLIAGTSSFHLDATDASIKLTGDSNPASSSVFTALGSDVGPTGGTNTKSAPTYTMRWEFFDDSVAVYDPNFLHFWFEDPAGSTNDYRLATVDISAAGTKPNTENWHYIFELELYSTDTDFTSAGFQVLMNLFGGLESVHVDATGIRLRPTTSAGGGSELSGSDLAPDGAPTVDTGADEITFTWTVADGVFDGTWAGTKIKIGTSFLTNWRWGGCKTDGSSCGTKAAGEEWTYEWTFAIVQGS